jgi:DNA-binding response OmpR family regulator
LTQASRALHFVIESLHNDFTAASYTFTSRESPMRSVAIIESQQNLSSTISAALRAEGLQAVTLRPEEGKQRLESYAFALLVLDLLAVADPYEFCRSVADRQPIIAVAANGDLDACVQILDAGAADCVPRSISTRELVARVVNLLWRAENRHPSSAGYELNSMDAMRVRVGNEFRDLSRGEAEVLSVLVEHAPAPLTIDQVLELLRSSPKVKRGTIASRLKSLRQKLGPGWIEVRAGFGYQLVPDKVESGSR